MDEVYILPECTLEFAKAAGEDYGFENAMRAAASQAAVALRFIADETFRNAVKEVFKG